MGQTKQCNPSYQHVVYHIFVYNYVFHHFFSIFYFFYLCVCVCLFILQRSDVWVLIHAISCKSLP